MKNMSDNEIATVYGGMECTCHFAPRIWSVLPVIYKTGDMSTWASKGAPENQDECRAACCKMLGAQGYTWGTNRETCKASESWVESWIALILG